MSNSDDELFSDDEEEAFLDREDPEHAIRCARQDISVKIKDFKTHCDALLAVAATVDDGCSQLLPEGALNSSIQSIERMMNERRERRSKALVKLEEENKKKETQLKVLVKLSKELEQERTQLYIQLQNEINGRENHMKKARSQRLWVSKATTYMFYIHILVILVLVAAYLHL